MPSLCSSRHRYRPVPQYSPRPLPSPPTFVARPSPPRHVSAASRARRLVAQACMTALLLMLFRFVLFLGDWEIALSDDAQAFKNRLVRGVRGFRAGWAGPENSVVHLSDQLVHQAESSDRHPSSVPAVQVPPPRNVAPSSPPAPAPALAPAPAVQARPARRRPDYFRGEWHLDRFSMFDVDRFSQFSYKICEVGDLVDTFGRPVAETEEARREREMDRAQEVAKWVWVPESRAGDGGEGRLGRRELDSRAWSSAREKRQIEGELEMPWKKVAASRRGWRDWTGLEMIEHLLKTDMGLLLVGDSLTGQMLSGLLAKVFISRPVTPDSEPIPFLIHPDPSTERSWPVPVPFSADDPLSASRPSPPPSGDDGPEPRLFRNDARHTFMLFLNPLARDAFFPHVDDARLARPVVTMIRADFLVHHPELVSMARDAPNGFDVPPREETEAGHPEAWREWIRMWLGPPDEGQGLVGNRKERSVVVFNTGAHWTLKGTMTGEAGREEERLQLVSEKVADRVVDFMRGYKRRVHLVYRTSSPGHPGCSGSAGQTVPSWARESTLVESEEGGTGAPGKWEWSTLGWERFESLDAVWRLKLDELANEERGGWMTDVMEVRQQALARGDAHLSPAGGDCLHWCAPSVPPQWAEGLGHLVLDPLPRDDSGPWYTSK